MTFWDWSEVAFDGLIVSVMISGLIFRLPGSKRSKELLAADSETVSPFMAVWLRVVASLIAGGQAVRVISKDSHAILLTIGIALDCVVVAGLVHLLKSDTRRQKDRSQ